MTKLSVLGILCVVLFLSGCAPTFEKIDDFKNFSAAQIYAKAQGALKNRDWKLAVKSYEALDAFYPFGEYSQQAQLNIIYAYYKNDDYASVLAAADRYARLYPSDPRVAYVYYMQGLVESGRDRNWLQKKLHIDRAQRDLTYLRSAFSDFNKVVRLYPESDYAPDARRHMLYIRNILAQHDLEISQFYYDRGAYVAAANRASDVVEHYQGAPQVIPALKMMIKSYQALGETKLAQETQAVLQASLAG